MANNGGGGEKNGEEESMGIGKAAGIAAGIAVAGWGLLKLVSTEFASSQTQTTDIEIETERKKMKAPGRRDQYIFRDDFTKNPRGYYRDLRDEKKKMKASTADDF